MLPIAISTMLRTGFMSGGFIVYSNIAIGSVKKMLPGV
jgi:hypothetical protein